MIELLTEDQKRYKKNREKTLVAMGPYATHAKDKISIDYWFKIQKESKTRGTTLNTSLNKLFGRQ